MLTRALAELGHQVAVLATAGVHRAQELDGVAILPVGTKSYGNGLIAGMCRRWQPEALIMVGCLWPVEPTQLAGVGVPIYPWTFIDTDPLGQPDKVWLETAMPKADIRLVAASRFAERVLAAKGYEAAAVIPLAVQPCMTPDRAAGLAWGREQGLSPDAFLFAKVGVNNELQDRKGFTETLLAFKCHLANPSHRNSWLYIHTEPQRSDGINLAYMAVTLGIQQRVRFPPEDLRGADLFPADWMAGMYRRANCFVNAAAGEGFGVPIIESLACGTPVIATRGSAMTELIEPEYGRLVSGQLIWAHHHNSWWVRPNATELGRAMDSMYRQAGQMRRAAELAGRRWTLETMATAWAELLIS